MMNKLPDKWFIRGMSNDFGREIEKALNKLNIPGTGPWAFCWDHKVYYPYENLIKCSESLPEGIEITLNDLEQIIKNNGSNKVYKIFN